LVAALAVTALAAANRGAQARRAYAAAGLELRQTSAIAVSAAAYSGNKVTKSGGLTGLAIHLADARRRSLDAARTSAAYVAVTVSGGVGSLILALVLVVAAAGPTLAVLGCLVVVLALSLLRRIGETSGRPLLALGRPAGFVARRARVATDRLGAPVAIDDLGTACRSIVGARTDALFVLVHAVLGKLLGAVTLFLVLRGLEVENLGPQVTLRVYAVTLAAAALGPLPAGIGTAEASLAAVLASHGVASTTALAAALVFRMFDVWIPVGIGALCLPSVLRRHTPVEPPPMHGDVTSGESPEACAPLRCSPASSRPSVVSS
jgi:uncharacterized membrane protein YbhN (UPF0104 family)